MNIYIYQPKNFSLTKFFVGGLHGKEGKATQPILKKFVSEGVSTNSRLIVIPALCKKRKYVSTLDKSYYETKVGKKLLGLIQKYKPNIYVELHCYRKAAYKLLTDPKRKEKKGVPPLVEVKNGVLIGSVSPHLLSKFNFDFAVVLEFPCKKPDSQEIILDLLRTIKNAENPKEILDGWSLKYQCSISKALKLYRDWRENIWLKN